MEKYMLYMGLLMTGIMTDNGSMNKTVALCIYGILAVRLAVWYFKKINGKEWYYYGRRAWKKGRGSDWIYQEPEAHWKWTYGIYEEGNWLQGMP